MPFMSAPAVSRRHFLHAGAACALAALLPDLRSLSRDAPVASDGLTTLLRPGPARVRMVGDEYPANRGLDLQRHRARPGAAAAPRHAVPGHGREPADREHHRALARHPPAECDGWRAGPHPAVDPAGRTLRLRLHPAGCRDVLVPLARRQPGADGPRPRRRADRRGGRAPRGRSRAALDHPGLAADERCPDRARVQQPHGNRRWTAGSATPSRSTAACPRPCPCVPASGSGCGCINAAIARIMALRFEGHRPVIVALDGQPCDPHEPADGRVLLGPAMRADVMLDMQGEPGRSYRRRGRFLRSALLHAGPPVLRQRARRFVSIRRMRRCACRPILCRARISRPPWCTRCACKAG